MSRQTTVTSNPQTAYEGMIDGDQFFSSVVITKIANPSAGISAGRGLTYVSGSDTKTDLPAASTDITDVTKFQGVSVYAPSITGAWPLPSTTGIYQQGQLVNILRRGRIWVYAEEAVAITDTVYCRYSSNGGNTILGRFGNTSDSSHAAAVPTARFVTSTTAAGLVLLEINLI